jgi:hypothetical protein
MNNRLDLIKCMTANAIPKMNEMREKFIALDEKIYEFWQVPCCPEAQRAFAIARTHLETALMYTNKGICLKYEIKEKSE